MNIPTPGLSRYTSRVRFEMEANGTCSCCCEQRQLVDGFGEERYTRVATCLCYTWPNRLLRKGKEGSNSSPLHHHCSTVGRHALFKVEAPVRCGTVCGAATRVRQNHHRQTRGSDIWSASRVSNGPWLRRITEGLAVILTAIPPAGKVEESRPPQPHWCTPQGNPSPRTPPACSPCFASPSPRLQRLLQHDIKEAFPGMSHLQRTSAENSTIDLRIAHRPIWTGDAGKRQACTPLPSRRIKFAWLP